MWSIIYTLLSFVCFGTLLIAALFVLCIVLIRRYYTSRRAFSVQTGIEIWEGIPGSGKSYGLTDLLIRTVLKLRRPVYTNLPVKIRVLRRYLRNEGGAEASRYVLPLDKAHFARFLDRNKAMAEFFKRRGLEDKHAGREAQPAVYEREFNDLFGRGVLRGADANWFPPAAVFIWDEAAVDFPMRTQANEPEELLAYVTMHRHHLHWFILAAQAATLISITFRKNASRLVKCVDKRRLPFLFGLKFPLPAFFYEEWPAEVLMGDQSFKKPTDQWIRLPFINGGLLWRLYSSFTHVGGRRLLVRKLNEMRREIEGGKISAPPEENTSMALVAKKSFLRRRWRLIVVIASFGLLVFAGWLLFHSPMPAAAKPIALRQDSVDASSGVGSATRRAVKDVPAAPVVVDPPLPAVSVVAVDFAVADGRVVNVGDSLGSLKLLSTSVENGRTLWAYGDRVFGVTCGFGVRHDVRPAAGTKATAAAGKGGGGGSPIIGRAAGAYAGSDARGPNNPAGAAGHFGGAASQPSGPRDGVGGGPGAQAPDRDVP